MRPELKGFGGVGLVRGEVGLQVRSGSLTSISWETSMYVLFLGLIAVGAVEFLRRTPATAGIAL